MKRTLLTAWIVAALGAMVLPADAGEALITKVHGRTLTIDKGADDGLETGLGITIVRPPSEAIIHPLTGENLGAPEIEVGSGSVNKVSARAASVQLDSNPIIPIRPGDVARFLTIEEKMVMDQEVATETMEKAANERGALRTEASRLARSISSIQGSIRGLEGAIRELRRFDNDVVKPQFNAINRQINDMREELEQLKTTVIALNSVPVSDMTEGEPGEMSPEEREQLRLVIEEEIHKLQDQLNAPPAAPTADTMTQPDLAVDDELAALDAEGGAFYTQIWFWGLLLGVGLAAIGAWYFLTQMDGGDEDDEEDDEDDELVDDDDDDDDFEVDVEEEDDIVVEETS